MRCGQRLDDGAPCASPAAAAVTTTGTATAGVVVMLCLDCLLDVVFAAVAVRVHWLGQRSRRRPA